MLFTRIEHETICCGTNSSLKRVRYLVVDVLELPLMLLFVSSLPQQSEHSPLIRLQNRTSALRYLLKRNLGSILALCGIVVALMYSHHVTQQHLAMLSTPAKKDLYLTNLHKINPVYDPTHPYTIMQVVSTDGEGVTLRLGNIQYSHNVSAFSYLTRGAYTGESLLSTRHITLTKAQLHSLYQEDVIYDVKRPEHGLIDGWLSTRFLEPHDRQFSF